MTRKKRNTAQFVRADDLNLPKEFEPGPGLVEALAQVMAGEIVPERRRVAVRDLVVRPEDVSQQFLAVTLAALKRDPPSTLEISVVALADGRYWAFDDAHLVRACQEVVPDLIATVAILPTGSSA